MCTCPFLDAIARHRSLNPARGLSRRNCPPATEGGAHGVRESNDRKKLSDISATLQHLQMWPGTFLGSLLADGALNAQIGLGESAPLVVFWAANGQSASSEQSARSRRSAHDPIADIKWAASISAWGVPYAFSFAGADARLASVCR